MTQRWKAEMMRLEEDRDREYRVYQANSEVLDDARRMLRDIFDDSSSTMDPSSEVHRELSLRLGRIEGGFRKTALDLEEVHEQALAEFKARCRTIEDDRALSYRENLQSMEDTGHNPFSDRSS